MELKNLAPGVREADLRTFLENIGRMLRQLEEQGKDSSHPQVKILIEEKLPKWILSEVLKYKLADPNWTVQKLKKKLEEIIHLKEEVARIHFDKANQHPKELNRFQPTRNPIINSQLAIILAKTQPLREYGVHPSRIPRQPCVFCSGHHWNDNCPQYRNRAQRLERLKELHL
uniref:Uncharacterized protein n=1 Tax=Ascaris lumbricoides TaxID=6252 RepID=A0A0M3HUZ7_ASCLU